MKTPQDTMVNRGGSFLTITFATVNILSKRLAGSLLSKPAIPPKISDSTTSNPSKAMDTGTLSSTMPAHWQRQPSQLLAITSSRLNGSHSIGYPRLTRLHTEGGVWKQ